MAEISSGEGKIFRSESEWQENLYEYTATKEFYFFITITHLL